MKKCTQCGLEYAQDFAFCPSCGGKLTDIAPPDEETVLVDRCTQCGAELREGDVFCTNCGARIAAPAPSGASAAPSQEQDRNPGAYGAAPGAAAGASGAHASGNAAPQNDFRGQEPYRSRDHFEEYDPFEDPDPFERPPEPDRAYGAAGAAATDQAAASGAGASYRAAGAGVGAAGAGGAANKAAASGAGASYRAAGPTAAGAAGAGDASGPDSGFGAQDTPEASGEPVFVQPAPPAKKKMPLAAKLSILGVLAACIAGFAIYSNITEPRPITINGANDIEVYVDEEFQIPVSADGLSESELQGIIWTSDDENLVRVENGILKASYDKNSFNATIDDTDGTDEESCTYTSHIYAEMHKGIRNWEGTGRVVVSLKPVEFENGKVLKEPADSKDSHIDITGSDDYSSYFYFKSKTKSANDMSFLIKQGETATIYVPCDKFEVYQAAGKTWYGSNILFGPQTVYAKDDQEYEFDSSSYWTLKLGVQNGNISSDPIDSFEFPE